MATRVELEPRLNGTVTERSDAGNELLTVVGVVDSNIWQVAVASDRQPEEDETYATTLTCVGLPRQVCKGLISNSSHSPHVAVRSDKISGTLGSPELPTPFAEDQYADSCNSQSIAINRPRQTDWTAEETV